MNRIKTAYENAAPTSGELAAYREEFIKELDAPQGTVKPLKAINRRRWRRVAIIVACLVLFTVAAGAVSSQIRTWVIDTDLRALKKLNVILPEKIGEYDKTKLQYLDRIHDGEEGEYLIFDGNDYTIKSGTEPMYRSYRLEYSKPNNLEYWNYDGGHGTQYRKDRIVLTFGFTGGLKDEDWKTYFHYDPESKKWIPYETNETPDLIRSVEDLEEISYRGATIWIYNLVTRNKEGKPSDYYDAGANWYDPEIGAYFQADFDTPTYDVHVDKAFDKNGNLIYESTEEWVRPTNVLDKETLLKYIKEIIDLNR